MRLLFVTASAVLTLCFVGLVGGACSSFSEDSSSGPDAAGAIDASGEASLVDASDAAVSVYGAFLTATRYPSNFENGASDVRAFVDQICSAAATSAGLANPESYHALIAVRSGAQASLDANLLQPYTAAPEGRWCAVAPSPSPHLDCNGSNLIFSTPSALVTGPEQSLVTDERGFTPTQGSPGLFLSGLNMPETGMSGLDLVVQNCASWSASIPAGDVDGGPISAGIGSAAHVGGPSVDFRWLGREPTRPCDTTLSLPLLCLQRPASP